MISRFCKVLMRCTVVVAHNLVHLDEIDGLMALKLLDIRKVSPDMLDLVVIVVVIIIVSDCNICPKWR